MKAVIAKEMAGPKEHLKFYDKFKDLISRKVYLKAILNYDFYYLTRLFRVRKFPIKLFFMIVTSLILFSLWSHKLIKCK